MKQIEHTGAPQAEKYVVEELGKAGKARGLRGFERIKCMHLDPEEWTVDNGRPLFDLKFKKGNALLYSDINIGYRTAGTVTPSFKLKRPQLQKRYQKQACSYL